MLYHFNAYNWLTGPIYTIGLNLAQLSMAGRILSNFILAITANVVVKRGLAALLTSQHMNTVPQANPLLDDRWRVEVHNWFVVSLAKLQQAITDPRAHPVRQISPHPETAKLRLDQK